MKPKSPKPRTKRGVTNPFFKSILIAFVVTISAWLLLTLVFSVVLSSLSDHTSGGVVMSMLVPVISLFVGGFVMGKLDKSTCFVGAVVLSAVVLALVYGLSVLFCLSKNMGTVMKTVQLACIFVSSLVGAKIASAEKGRRRPNRRRM